MSAGNRNALFELMCTHPNPLSLIRGCFGTEGWLEPAKTWDSPRQPASDMLRHRPYRNAAAIIHPMGNAYDEIATIRRCHTRIAGCGEHVSDLRREALRTTTDSGELRSRTTITRECRGAH